ncbi:MAG: helix-turn-helix domain-containing protein [Alphaproteobacteria bacterium]|nr:helix-turn-helix domain-containing protein [Alphaproteobacteria bacterium]
MNIWFPPDEICNSQTFIFNSTHHDLQEQAAIYEGIDLRYTQLSAGAFRGRMLHAALGDVAINIEYCNQSLEKDIHLSPNDYSFCLTLDDPVPFSVYGVDKSRDWIHVIPPDGESFVITPKDGTIMVLTIRHDALLECAGLLPEVNDWFRKLNKRGDFVKSPQLTSQLKAVALLALESATAVKHAKHRTTIDRGILLNFATAFTLEWLKQNDLSTFRSTPAFERFHQVRRALIDDIHSISKDGLSTLENMGSRRSIEQAFSENLHMGPLRYTRLVRLHRVREKLLDESRLDANIGDIAAEDGFWDWSRFSIHYRKQFGELPSETRCRAAS